MSYTKFKYENLKIANNWKTKNTVTVSLDISNIGSQDAKEVVQLYVSDISSSVPRPIKELKGFKKINLKQGETQTVSFELSKKAFAFWSIEKHDWIVESGEFEILIGASSSDILLKKAILIDLN